VKPSLDRPKLADLAGVFAALLGLLALSWLSLRLQPGPARTALGLGIACAKAALIALFFMKLREQHGLVRVFAASGLFWLSILGSLLAADYLSRALLGF
jgi:cytochrome c oxidase subunit 4